MDESGPRYLIDSAALGFPKWTVYLRKSTLEITMPVSDIPRLDDFLHSVETRLRAAGLAPPVFGKPKLSFTLELPLKSPANKALEALYELSERLPPDLKRAMLERIGRVDVERVSKGMEWLIFRYSAVETERPGFVMPLADKHLMAGLRDRPFAELLGWVSLLSSELDMWLWLAVLLCVTKMAGVEEGEKFGLLKLIAFSSPIPEVFSWIIEMFKGLYRSLSDEDREVIRAFATLMLSSNKPAKALLSYYSDKPAEGSEGTGTSEEQGP